MDLAVLVLYQEINLKMVVEKEEVIRESIIINNKEILDIKAKKVSKKVIEILKRLKSIIIFYSYLERISLIKKAEGITVQLPTQGKILI